jgi:hypothetical protein
MAEAVKLEPNLTIRGRKSQGDEISLLRKVLLAGKILFVMKEKLLFYCPSARVTTSKEEISNSFSLLSCSCGTIEGQWGHCVTCVQGHLEVA